MIQPLDMKETRPIKLHDGGVSTTTEVWSMLSASFNGDLLIEHGADIDYVDDEYRSTPLGYAARWAHLEMVKLLLASGADIHKSGAPWSTPLAYGIDPTAHDGCIGLRVVLAPR